MRILVSLILLAQVFTSQSKPGCSEKTASLLYNRHIHHFSMRILQRVSTSERGSFVFSPISTWLQLLHLYEGSEGATSAQIHKVIGKGNDCFKNKIQSVTKDAVNVADDLLMSYMVIDNVLAVKPAYKAMIKSHGLTDLIEVNFSDPSEAEKAVNRLVNEQSNGVNNGLFDEDDFKRTLLLLFDVVDFETNFANTFNSIKSTVEPFYTDYGKVGVQMMSQLGVFNVTKLPRLDITILELPCDLNDRIKMLLIQTEDVADIYTTLSKTQLSGVFNSFIKSGERSVRVTMPKVDISSFVDNLPELLYDMGVRDVFDPDRSNLKGISDYKLYASSMKQIASFQVNEGSGPVVHKSGSTRYNDGVYEFKLDKPFGFLIVDKLSELILLGGVFKKPYDN